MKGLISDSRLWRVESALLPIPTSPRHCETPKAFRSLKISDPSRHQGRLCTAMMAVPGHSQLQEHSTSLR